MTATSVTSAATLNDPAPPAAQVRAHAPPRPALHPNQLTILIERVEGMLADGSLDLHDDWEPADEVALTAGELILLLARLFPEAFAEPPPPTARLGSAPGSGDRVADYARRAAAGVGLYHPDDAEAVKDDRAVIASAARPNGSGFQATGWADGAARILAVATRAVKSERRVPKAGARVHAACGR